MGYNISDITLESSGGPSDWTFTLDLSDPSVSTVSGDFNVVSVFDGTDLGEATDGYSFSALSTTDFGTLSFDETDGTFTFTVDRDAVLDSNSDQVVSFDITGTSGSDSDQDTVTINILICVLRGTRIETAAGPVPVEQLEAGDIVLTLDNGPQPVRWIGSKSLSLAELARDPTLRPIRISQGALGHGRPGRDLLVSPNHRVLLSDWRAEMLFGETEVLVPAKALVNDQSIQVELSDTAVEYFHILFDTHEIIQTEGAPTESFHPGRHSVRELGDAVKVELHRFFPQLFETNGYGDTARLSLRPWEGELIWQKIDPDSETSVA